MVFIGFFTVPMWKPGIIYLANKLVDPENHPFLMETHLPPPMTGRVVMLIYWRVGFCSTNGGFSPKKKEGDGRPWWDQWWMRMVLFGIIGLLKKMGKT